MNEIFGIDNQIVKQALINGIKIKKGEEFVPVIGFISLTYVVQFNKFIITYGTSEIDSGFVFVEDHGTTWVLK